MKRIYPGQDIRPVSEFRKNAAALLEQVRTTRRPLVLTQRGRSAAVLLAVSEYERLLETLQVLQDALVAERESNRGEALDHEAVLHELLGTLPE